MDVFSMNGHFPVVYISHMFFEFSAVSSSAGGVSGTLIVCFRNSPFAVKFLLSNWEYS